MIIGNSKNVYFIITKYRFRKFLKSIIIVNKLDSNSNNISFNI